MESIYNKFILSKLNIKYFLILFYKKIIPVKNLNYIYKNNNYYFLDFDK